MAVEVEGDLYEQLATTEGSTETTFLKQSCFLTRKRHFCIAITTRKVPVPYVHVTEVLTGLSQAHGNLETKCLNR